MIKFPQVLTIFTIKLLITARRKYHKYFSTGDKHFRHCLKKQFHREYEQFTKPMEILNSWAGGEIRDRYVKVSMGRASNKSDYTYVITIYTKLINNHCNKKLFSTHTAVHTLF